MINKQITALADKYDIILGSSSPRRMKLLKETGIIFSQLIPDIHEIQEEKEPPFQFAVRLARDKALSLRDKLNENQLVIGCDTIVILEDIVLGKPEDETDAFKMLSNLSGNKHQVCTALAISSPKEILAEGYDVTSVYFNTVTDDEIKKYIKTGEPMDKAGSYGIQGMGSFLVDRIEGNLDTVIGFPRGLLEELAKRIIEKG